MKEQIKNFLISQHWISNGDDFSMEFQIPGRQLIVNGEPIVQPPQTKTIEIKYLGEGEFSNIGEEPEPIYGYNIADNDIWVFDLDDFKDWYIKIFKNN